VAIRVAIDGTHLSVTFSAIATIVERPFRLSGMDATTRDGERVDDEPGSTLGENPRRGIKSLAEIGCVGVDMIGFGSRSSVPVSCLSGPPGNLVPNHRCQSTHAE
jgi:hypothetical protein